MKNKLSIIIITWNSMALLKNCLDSIFNSIKKYDYEIIVCDNASSDGTVEFLKEKYPKIKLIENEKNYGFAKANNIALKFACGSYILLLNHDTIILDNALDKMFNFMLQNKVDIIGPKLLNEDGSVQRWGAGFFPNAVRAFNHYFFISSLLKSGKIIKSMYISPKDNETMPVDWISGAALMFRQEVIKTIGVLKEDYFMYAEDIEFCLRAKNADLKIVYYPFAVIKHLNKRNLQKKILQSEFESIYNISLFYRQKTNKIKGLIFDIIIFFGFFLRFLIYVVLYILSKEKYKPKIIHSKKMTYVSLLVLFNITAIKE